MKSFFFFFSLLPLTVFSQPGTVTLRFSPLALVDNISFPTIQGGIEYGLTKKFASYNEFGIKYRSSAYEVDFIIGQEKGIVSAPFDHSLTPSDNQ
jgi:hypothetical protein